MVRLKNEDNFPHSLIVKEAPDTATNPKARKEDQERQDYRVRIRQGAGSRGIDRVCETRSMYGASYQRDHKPDNR